MFKRLWDALWRVDYLQLWHQDSPGVRVWVRRNIFQRLAYPRLFSAVGERHLNEEEASRYLALDHQMAQALLKRRSNNRWLPCWLDQCGSRG